MTKKGEEITDGYSGIFCNVPQDQRSQNHTRYHFDCLCKGGIISEHFLGGLEDAESKTGNFKNLTRKTNYSSFFSVLSPDLKNVFFGKIH